MEHLIVDGFCGNEDILKGTVRVTVPAHIRQGKRVKEYSYTKQSPENITEEKHPHPVGVAPVAPGPESPQPTEKPRTVRMIEFGLPLDHLRQMPKFWKKLHDDLSDKTRQVVRRFMSTYRIPASLEEDVRQESYEILYHPDPKKGAVAAYLKRYHPRGLAKKPKEGESFEKFYYWWLLNRLTDRAKSSPKEGESESSVAGWVQRVGSEIHPTPEVPEEAGGSPEEGGEEGIDVKFMRRKFGVTYADPELDVPGVSMPEPERVPFVSRIPGPEQVRMERDLFWQANYFRLLLEEDLANELPEGRNGKRAIERMDPQRRRALEQHLVELQNEAGISEGLRKLQIDWIRGKLAADKTAEIEGLRYKPRTRSKSGRALKDEEQFLIQRRLAPLMYSGKGAEEVHEQLTSELLRRYPNWTREHARVVQSRLRAKVQGFIEGRGWGVGTKTREGREWKTFPQKLIVSEEALAGTPEKPGPARLAHAERMARLKSPEVVSEMRRKQLAVMEEENKRYRERMERNRELESVAGKLRERVQEARKDPAKRAEAAERLSRHVAAQREHLQTMEHEVNFHLMWIAGQKEEIRAAIRDAKDPYVKTTLTDVARSLDRRERGVRQEGDRIKRGLEKLRGKDDNRIENLRRQKPEVSTSKRTHGKDEPVMPVAPYRSATTGKLVEKYPPPRTYTRPHETTKVPKGVKVKRGPYIAPKDDEDPWLNRKEFKERIGKLRNKADSWHNDGSAEADAEIQLRWARYLTKSIPQERCILPIG